MRWIRLVYLMPRTNWTVRYPTTERTMNWTWCSRTPSWYCFQIYIFTHTRSILIFAINEIGKLNDLEYGWNVIRYPNFIFNFHLNLESHEIVISIEAIFSYILLYKKCCVEFNLPPPFANIGGIDGITVPVGCIRLAGGIVTPASWPTECRQIVSAQLGICHWLLALGPMVLLPPPPTPPPLPQYESVAKLSWLPEHCKRWGRGGDDCLE